MNHAAGVSLGRLLHLQLLDKGEHRVQEDHRDYRHCQGSGITHEGEHRRRPDQKHQWVRELSEERAQMAAALPAPDLVRPVLLEPTRGLTFRKPLVPGPEVPQEEVYALFRIEVTQLYSPAMLHRAYHPFSSRTDAAT
jgi:hypothetical protein